jgi:S-DNA-T family DNA segregation ATPase FtsK/SpoIIIE
VYAVRVTSPGRGWLRIEATACDPLAETSQTVGHGRSTLLRAVVGRREDGRPWVLDFRMVPHWLVVGATRSGKSTLLNALMVELVSQPLALVGIDCKGGMELGAYEPRLSALATNRREAVGVLAGMVELLGNRMRLCQRQHARNIWELPEHMRPVPVVLLVDEVAELFLVAQRSEKDEAARAATLLIRIAQLGAALGLHLVVAGQRVGSDLGTGVTALRAQLAGRVCHRVADPETAVMALGDLNPDALIAAQTIGTEQPGVAVIADETGAWQRARSVNVPAALAEMTARQYAALAPELLEFTAGLRSVGVDRSVRLDEGREAA